MPQKLLSIDEIKELSSLVRNVLSHIKSIKKDHKIGTYIKNPQIPVAISESLTVHLLERGLIPELSNYEFKLAGNKSDIFATSGDKKLNIEVKATGPKAFQKLGNKDIEADYLIWVHFDDFFMQEQDKKIKVYITKKLKENKLIENPRRINLKNFQKIIGNRLTETEIVI